VIYYSTTLFLGLPALAYVYAGTLVVSWLAFISQLRLCYGPFVARGGGHLIEAWVEGVGEANLRRWGTTHY
jgi:hypothetical protein